MNASFWFTFELLNKMSLYLETVQTALRIEWIIKKTYSLENKIFI